MGKRQSTGDCSSNRPTGMVVTSLQEVSRTPRTVSAADANRQFSTILGHAVEGETVIITRRGAPVAQLTPYGRPPADEARAAAWNRLLTTLEEGVHLGGAAFDRDSLYDR